MKSWQNWYLSLHIRDACELWTSLIIFGKNLRLGAAIRRCFSKWVFLNIPNIHRKTFVLESLFNKVTGLMACNLIKKRLQHRCFSVSIAKFLRTHFCKKHLRWLLLFTLDVSPGSWHASANFTKKMKFWFRIY